MKPNTIEYLPSNRLVYYNTTRDTKIPIAFVPVAGDITLLVNSTSPWNTKRAVRNTVSTMKAESADSVPALRSDALRLTDLTTKRMCYFARISGSLMRITKVENVGRNTKPNNLLGSTDWAISKMPADLVAAVKALIANPIMPTSNKFGTYIPLPLFKLIEKTSNRIKNHTTELVVPGNPVTFEIDRNHISDTYTLYKKVNGKSVWMITCAEIRDRKIVVNPIFDDLKHLIIKHAPIGSIRNTVLSIEDGEMLYRAFEASKIESKIRYQMVMAKRFGSGRCCGSVLAVLKFAGDDVIATVNVADLEGGKITPFPGFECHSKLIERFLPGPHDNNIRDMDEISGELFFELKKESQAKPSVPANDISPKVTDKKIEVKPLNINSKTILI